MANIQFKDVKLCLYVISVPLLSIILLYTSDNCDILNSRIKGRNIPRPRVITVILSARSNFERRNTLRNTWLSLLNDTENGSENNYVFVVGSEACPYPVEDRISEHSCEFWNISSGDYKTITSTCAVINQSENLNYIHQGFNFIVLHPIKVIQLGILKSALPPHYDVRISLLNQLTNDIVAAKSVKSGNHVEESNGYLWIDIEELTLPKNFHGSLLVEGDLYDSSNDIVTLNNASGVISFTNFYGRYDHTYDERFQSTFATSLLFNIRDSILLDKHVNERVTRTSSWKQHVSSESSNLRKENIKYGDLLILNMQDTYRNIPLKLIKTFEWLKENKEFQYVLKTDDDCIINYPNVVEEISILSKNKTYQRKVWFGRFRTNWRVDRIGKWKETEYTASLYPKFACGSGYVLSDDIIGWIADNSQYLHLYQGEDTSLGIWLSAINPQYINDERWGCDAACKTDSYSRSQLSEEEIIDSWSNFKRCQSICNCND